MNKPPKSSQQKNRKIIAGLPAFNEEQYIGTIILQTNQYVDEVIIVDDGSSDRTAEVARLAGATVIQHEHNMGYGASIQTLITEAKKMKPDIFILLDADSQHNPDEIPGLVKPVFDGFDIVIGSREAQKEDVPRYRRIGQRIISNFSHVLSGEEVSDSESGFRAFSGKAIASLSLRETGMAVSAETISRASEEGLKITDMKGLGATNMMDVSLDATYELALEVDSKDAEVVFISCTGLRSLELIDRLEKELDKPVISSNTATMWNVLRILGIDDPLKGCGILFD